MRGKITRTKSGKLRYHSRFRVEPKGKPHRHVEEHSQYSELGVFAGLDEDRQRREVMDALGERIERDSERIKESLRRAEMYERLARDCREEAAEIERLLELARLARG